MKQYIVIVTQVTKEDERAKMRGKNTVAEREAGQRHLFFSSEATYNVTRALILA